MNCCKIDTTLSQKELRNTKERHKLLELFDQARTWSASQLSDQIRKTNLSTIYRNLKAFEKAGLIESAYERNGEMVYELASRNHHDHMICRVCESGECIPCKFEGRQDHSLQVFDTCSDCRA